MPPAILSAIGRLTRYTSTRHRSLATSQLVSRTFHAPPPRQMSEQVVFIPQLSGVKPTAAVVFLHGSGGCGEEWAEMFDQRVRSTLPHVAFLFPSAAPRPYTLFGGQPLEVWFDRNSLGLGCKEDHEGIAASVAQVERAMTKHVPDVPHSRIVMAGFSQGGGLALYAAYGPSNKEAYAGCVASGSFIPDPTMLIDSAANGAAAATSANSAADASAAAASSAASSLSSAIPAPLRSTPLLLVHGTSDPVVPYASGVSTYERLKSRAQICEVEHVQRKGMVHTIDNTAMRSIMQFIQRVLPQTTA